jgi:hypothetical protein
MKIAIAVAVTFTPEAYFLKRSTYGIDPCGRLGRASCRPL